MTPEQQIAAIARLEARVEGIDAWLKSIDEKLDDLTAVANKGKGVLRTFLILGGSIGAIATFANFVWQHIRVNP